MAARGAAECCWSGGCVGVNVRPATGNQSAFTTGTTCNASEKDGDAYSLPSFATIDQACMWNGFARFGGVRSLARQHGVHPGGDSLQCWCKFGFGDCDNNVFNGCEVNFDYDSNHCGSCGNACTSPQTCFVGKCDCTAANCNCANFATDPDNCGSCGTSVDDGDPCTEDLCANGTPSHVTCPNCVDGVCCESACNGSCEACSKAKNGYGDGFCRSIPYFSDPDDE